ncbi:LysR substrate-binding domain-containing protein [Marinomonas sp. 2405UD66-6]|uniref:LysR substrate-binding domain-containing protein n=1 Tax=Marinomonas sp. 2405UD66-6 TaxID=3391834 RepID=UPI0039C9DE1B
MAHGTPPFNALYTFIITAKHLNLTHAANELFVTQGAVSRQIASLESYLGFKVFLRHARGLSLTAKGTEILPNIKAAYQQILDTTKLAMESNGEIKLKATTCSTRWLIPHLVKLQNNHPESNVILTVCTEHEVDFGKENFDAAIIYTENPKSFVDKAAKTNALTIKLFDERLCPVIAPSLMETSKHFDINNCTFLHPTEDKKDWQLWIDENKQDGITMMKNQHFETMDLAISAAIQGLGVTIADLSLVQEDIRMNRLQKTMDHDVLTGASYYLVFNPLQIMTPAVETFINVLTSNKK